MSSALDAYEKFAPIYDEFNAVNDYELWLGSSCASRPARSGTTR